MRATTTAVALAIAASLAAGDDSGKSGKSGTKSSKSGDCTDCSADTLTRANLVTSLFVSNWAVDGVLDQESASQYCDADTDEKEAFLKAVENTAGCLINDQTQCLIDLYFDIIIEATKNNFTITEGFFQAVVIDGLCTIEQEGFKFDCGDVPDPCNPDDPRARALEADQFEQHSEMNSLVKGWLGL